MRERTPPRAVTMITGVELIFRILPQTSKPSWSSSNLTRLSLRDRSGIGPGFLRGARPSRATALRPPVSAQVGQVPVKGLPVSRGCCYAAGRTDYGFGGDSAAVRF